MKPLEAFGIEKRSTDGHRCECKKCRNERVRERYKDPSVKAQRAASRRKRRQNPEYRNNRNAYQRKRRKNPVVNAQLNAYDRKRRQNPEFRAKERKRSRNPEVKAKRNARARKRYKEDPEFRIQSLLRSRLHSALKGNAKVAPTMNLVGCTPEELKWHLHAQFLPGMSWENMGRVWHIDHIIPYKAFDMGVEEDQRIVNWYMNLQPLWGPDNLKKSGKYEEEDKLDLIRHYDQCKIESECRSNVK